jgi:hypothetical protein
MISSYRISLLLLESRVFLCDGRTDGRTDGHQTRRVYFSHHNYKQTTPLQHNIKGASSQQKSMETLSINAPLTKCMAGTKATYLLVYPYVPTAKRLGLGP